ncbi:MAG: hypothetical protein ING52_18060 [Burkholderiales bacterium]|jgi:hypothetical protein|nr:hypothetical protein [Burkholderiales bacterium]MCA3227383.1 hypothetical protein [Burkholderiales bacterium]MCE2646981.1 hypothetical protein [Burkholderiaceae bacterium]
MKNPLSSPAVARAVRFALFVLLGIAATFVGVNWLFGLSPVQPIIESWGGVALGPRIAIGLAQSLGALAYWAPRTHRFGIAVLALMMLFFAGTNFVHGLVRAGVIDLAILGVVVLAGYLGHPVPATRRTVGVEGQQRSGSAV